MSDERAPAADPRQPAPTAWGQPIPDDRKRQLEVLFAAQMRWAELPTGMRGESNVAGEKLTGADVFWLAEQSGRSAIGSVPNLRLEGADLSGAHLEGALLLGAHLEGADLSGAHLEGASLFGAHLEHANLNGAYLGGAHLNAAYLEGAFLLGAHLEHADLNVAHLEGAHLNAAHLEGVALPRARLEGADLRQCLFDSKTLLNGATLDDKTQLGDIQWSGVGAVNLTQIAWENVSRLGDERGVGLRASAADHRAVVRAYRQLAAQLRAQGMAEEADRFSYRAQVRQRGVLLRAWRLPQYLFSWLLAILAGYGYRPGRTLFWYLAVVLGYAFAYLHVGPSVGVPLSPLGALVFSVTSFHGRGFFPGGSPGHSITLDDPLTVLAASEAVVGLLIEISFIATFTQRYFGAK